jgi:hypothetical protein
LKEEKDRLESELNKQENSLDMVVKEPLRERKMKFENKEES